MPKLYEYLGIILMFYANEHEPIHVHATTKDGKEIKVLFYIKSSKITRIVYKEIKGKKPLNALQNRNLKKLINQEKYNIVDAWIKFFVLHDKIRLKRITKKIK